MHEIEVDKLNNELKDQLALRDQLKMENLKDKGIVKSIKEVRDQIKNELALTKQSSDMMNKIHLDTLKFQEQIDKKLEERHND